MKKNYPDTYPFPLPDGLSLDLILVKAGRFIMGSEGEDAYSDESPEHIVKLTEDYYISKCPISQAQWEAVTGNLPEQSFPGKQRPITDRSWIDICRGNQEDTREESFLKRLNDYAATAGSIFHAPCFALPTEAQWEYAAKDGHLAKQEDLEHKKSADIYTAYSGSQKLKEVAWFTKNSHDETKKVGEKKPNALGIHDMTGNVWEWCEDVFERGFYEKGDKEKWINPCNRSDDMSQFRVLRGGSLGNGPQDCRISCRNFFHPSYRDFNIGFRLVLSSFSLAVS